MRVKWWLGAWGLAVLGACGGSTRNPSGTSVGDGGDGSGGAPGSGDAGADAAEGGSEPVDRGTPTPSGAAGEPGTGGSVSPGSGGAVGACVPGIMNTCLCANGANGFHYCGADGEWDDCICGGAGLGGTANAGGTGGTNRTCIPTYLQYCTCPGGIPGARECSVEGFWGPCVCETGGASGSGNAGGAAGEGGSGAPGEGGGGPDGGTAGSAGTSADGGSAGECAGTLCGTECVDLDTDVDHCGACGEQCALLPHAESTTCLVGVCAIVCAPGWSDCDADPSNGCEVDVENDPAHCGACGADCSQVSNVEQAGCDAGSCTIESCDAGFGDCDAVHANGCEVILDTDSENCGQCAAVCSDGVCNDGECV